jgi:hypothetical protein
MLFLAVALTLVAEPGQPADGQPQHAASNGIAGVAFRGGNVVYFPAIRDHGHTLGKPVRVAEYPRLDLGRHRVPRIVISGGADGGGIAVAPNGRARAVWRRLDHIVEAEPGKPESLIAEGKDPTIAAAPSRVFIAWSMAQALRTRSPGSPEPVNLGPGGYIQLQAFPNASVLAAWESPNRISMRILE